MSKNFELKMTEGKIFKLIIKFAFPLILTNMLQLLFNAADVIVVGRFAGKEALAAVGSVGPIINILVNIAIGLSVGCNIICSRAFGSDNKSAIHRTVHCSIALGLLCGIVIMPVGLFFSRKILVLLDSPSDVIDLANLYLKIYFSGIIPILLYNFGASILRGVGDTKRPLIYITVSGVVNACLNLIFVIAFKMGVAGVALATVISWVISSFLIIRALIKTDAVYKLELKKIRLYKDEAIQALGIGIPSGIQGCVFSLSNLVITSAINSLGTIVVAGSAAAGNIEGFVYQAMNAFHYAVVTFVSQNYGARKFKRIPKGLYAGIISAIVTGLIFGEGVYIFRYPLLRLYTTIPEVVEMGANRISIIAVFYFLCGAMDAISGGVKGYGKALTSTLVSIIGSCVLRLIWVWTVFDHISSTFTTLLTCYPLSWTITALTNFVAFCLIHKHKVKTELDEI